MNADNSARPAPLILLVDDFADNRTMYAAYLSAVGFRTAEAATGLDAIQRAQQLEPDLVVMDLTLPGIDGWETTRRLRSDPRTASIAVIALTGNVQEGQMLRAREAGCDAFLTKPCLPRALVAEIYRVLGGLRLEAAKAVK